MAGVKGLGQECGVTLSLWRRGTQVLLSDFQTGKEQTWEVTLSFEDWNKKSPLGYSGSKVWKEGWLDGSGLWWADFFQAGWGEGLGGSGTALLGKRGMTQCLKECLNCLGFQGGIQRGV